MTYNNSTVSKIQYFPEIIAQEKVKSALSLHLDGYKANGFLPPIAIISPRGTGKTSIMSALAANLKKSDGTTRPFLNLNCSSVKNLSQFVSQIIIPYQNTEITYGLDETHILPKDCMTWLLSVISPNANRKSSAYFDNVQYDFDFNKVSWISASTNPEKLSAAFLSRLERIDLDEYKDEDLIRILYKVTPEIKYLNNIELDIASVCRSTPREVIKIADKIKQYLSIHNKEIFDKSDWAELKKRANINVLGLNSHEIKHLMALKEFGHLSLTMLAAKIRLDRVTVQKNIENFLLERSLINIEGHRFLSSRGRKVLEEIEKS